MNEKAKYFFVRFTILSQRAATIPLRSPVFLSHSAEKNLKLKIVMLTTAVLVVVSTNIVLAREYISIVGSSTVYPFSTVVAERFGKASDFSAPIVESTGSGGGLNLFCAGIGEKTPDITNSSRRIKQSEVDLCAGNGVMDIVEVLIGFDGIVLANARGAPVLKLTRKDVFLALGKSVPGSDGKLIPNPYKTWQEVNPALPDIRIEVLGPPPTSGTRDAFAEMALEAGAEMVPELAVLDAVSAVAQVKAVLVELGLQESIYTSFEQSKGRAPSGSDIFTSLAHAIREDGAYIEVGENDNLIVQKLVANPAALGVFGFSFLDQNADKVQGSVIDGKTPTFENIASGDYPISRPLYFYVKKAHVGRSPV